MTGVAMEVVARQSPILRCLPPPQAPTVSGGQLPPPRPPTPTAAPALLASHVVQAPVWLGSGTKQQQQPPAEDIAEPQAAPADTTVSPTVTPEKPRRPTQSRLSSDRGGFCASVPAISVEPPTPAQTIEQSGEVAAPTRPAPMPPQPSPVRRAHPRKPQLHKEPRKLAPPGAAREPPPELDVRKRRRGLSVMPASFSAQDLRVDRRLEFATFTSPGRSERPPMRQLESPPADSPVILPKDKEIQPQCSHSTLACVGRRSATPPPPSSVGFSSVSSRRSPSSSAPAVPTELGFDGSAARAHIAACLRDRDERRRVAALLNSAKFDSGPPRPLQTPMLDAWRGGRSSPVPPATANPSPPVITATRKAAPAAAKPPPPPPPPPPSAPLQAAGELDPSRLTSAPAKPTELQAPKPETELCFAREPTKRSAPPTTPPKAGLQQQEASRQNTLAEGTPKKAPRQRQCQTPQQQQRPVAGDAGQCAPEGVASAERRAVVANAISDLLRPTCPTGVDAKKPVQPRLVQTACRGTRESAGAALRSGAASLSAIADRLASIAAMQDPNPDSAPVDDAATDSTTATPRAAAALRSAVGSTAP
eukprot:Hpha_TRINITY_DN15996_c1_g16::TRINITY_DN15996_c1_g16_i1::g.74440::m.74440